jgi:hypothetical protein
MPDSKLTKEQQDYCYAMVDYFHNITTDMANCDKEMHQGRFFDAMDNIRVCNQTSQLGEKKIKEFVQSLQKSGLW